VVLSRPICFLSVLLTLAGCSSAPSEDDDSAGAAVVGSPSEAAAREKAKRDQQDIDDFTRFYAKLELSQICEMHQYCGSGPFGFAELPASAQDLFGKIGDKGPSEHCVGAIDIYRFARYSSPHGGTHYNYILELHRKGATDFMVVFDDKSPIFESDSGGKTFRRVSASTLKPVDHGCQQIPLPK